MFDRDEKFPSSCSPSTSATWRCSTRCRHSSCARLRLRSDTWIHSAIPPTQDLYVDEHGQLDFKVSYDFSKQFSAFFQVQNINDEPLRFFSGDKSRLAENEIYSWNMLARV